MHWEQGKKGYAQVQGSAFKAAGQICAGGQMLIGVGGKEERRIEIKNKFRVI